MPDGSVLLVEMERQALSRVASDGSTSVVAKLGGGPNGAALGPDGRCYVCNNGGMGFMRDGDRILPGLASPDYAGGWIDAVDLHTAEVEHMYTVCGTHQIRGPNDLVFDADGGFWFTDLGKTFKGAAQRDRGAVYYARPDGRSISRVIFPLEGPNGIGLSPDGATLYVAESTTGRVWAFRVVAPGVVERHAAAPAWEKGRLLWAPDYYCTLDSLAVDGDGNVCVADIPTGCITVISPQGRRLAQVHTGDPITTNICFGGSNMKTAFVTASSTGRLLTTQWPRSGLQLHWNDHA